MSETICGQCFWHYSKHGYRLCLCPCVVCGEPTLGGGALDGAYNRKRIADTLRRKHRQKDKRAYPSDTRCDCKHSDVYALTADQQLVLMTWMAKS